MKSVDFRNIGVELSRSELIHFENLEEFGLKELSHEELKEIDGGFLFGAFLVAAITAFIAALVTPA